MAAISGPSSARRRTSSAVGGELGTFDTAEARLQGVRRPDVLTRTLQKLGLYDRRNMRWSWTPGRPRNFGDWVGPLIFAGRRRRSPLYHRLKPGGHGCAYVTAGSIMGHISRPDAAIVWGAGIIARYQDFARPRRICAVRGPITRARCLELGYECPEIYGDPAILLPRLFGIPAAERRFRLGIIPHLVNFAEARDLFGSVPGVRIIDVGQPVGRVVEEICSCDETVSSSLHGLIVSHAYGRPAAWVTFQAQLKGDGTKFSDYYLGCGVDTPRPLMISSGTEAEELVQLATDAPLPDVRRLEDDLLAVCPF